MFGLGLRRFLGYGTSFSFGNCLKLDGANDYGTFTQTNFGTVNSIEFWIKTTDTVGFILGNSAGGSDYVAFNSTNNVFEYRSSWTAQSATITGFVITDGFWHHVAIARSGLNVKYYLDGSPHTEKTASGTNRTFDLNYLGQYGNGTGFFGGALDELRIYGNYVMSDAEVLSQYNSGNGAPPLAKTPHAADIFWSFNESNPSTTVADSSGNSKTLTLSNINHDANSGFFDHAAA